MKSIFYVLLCTAIAGWLWSISQRNKPQQAPEYIEYVAGTITLDGREYRYCAVKKGNYESSVVLDFIAAESSEFKNENLSVGKGRVAVGDHEFDVQANSGNLISKSGETVTCTSHPLSRSDTSACQDQRLRILVEHFQKNP